VRVIGVVDLLAGRAVHARAGRRESYEPVRTVAGAPIEPGDGLALAGAYVDRLGIASCTPLTWTRSSRPSRRVGRFGASR